MNRTEKFPVIFNCIKHHLSYISERIDRCRSDNDLTVLSKELLNIGHSPLDLYIGNIAATEIISEIIQQLKNEKKFIRNDYSSWIKKNKGYSQLTVSDDSVWTLRFNETNKNYIHIHPSRNSRNALRVNASVVRSAVLYVAFCKIHRPDRPDLIKVNHLRAVYLSLPPLKKITDQFLQLCNKIEKGNE